MSGIAERLAEVLAEHLHRGTSGRLIGTYGITVDDFADALLPVVEREIAAARGEAAATKALAWALTQKVGYPAIPIGTRVSVRSMRATGTVIGPDGIAKDALAIRLDEPYPHGFPDDLCCASADECEPIALSPDPDRGEGEA